MRILQERRFAAINLLMGCILVATTQVVSAQGFGILRGALQQAIQNRPSPQPRVTPSRPQQVQVRAASPQPTRIRSTPKPKKVEPTSRYALIIAARDYSGSTQLQSLPGTNRDADLIAAALRKGGFPTENIMLLYDNAGSPGRRPTRNNILTSFDEFLTIAKQGVAAVFLTGHGITLEGTSYYCPADATDAMLKSPDAARDGLISIQHLTTRLSKECAANHKLIVVDACRSGDQKRFAGLVKNLSALEEDANDVWVLSSCSEGQRSWITSSIVKGEQHPIFSYYVARGLEGSADLLGDNDGRVGLFELFSYAYVKTAATSKEFVDASGKPIRQTPELFGLAPPFELSVVRNLVARRTLTTGNVQAEASRSADQIADDMLTNLRAAEFHYRSQVGAPNSSEVAFEVLSRNYHNYLCYLLGNRIESALTLDNSCKLAHVARGITYRATGMYADALDGFRLGDESFDLFVKASENTFRRRTAHDNQGLTIRDNNDQPVLQLASSEAPTAADKVYLYDQPNGKLKYYVVRESKVSITDVQGDEDQQWLFVSAVNDVKTPGGWLRRSDVHWLPEAIDLYTPRTAMRPFGSPAFSAANRIDYAADRIHQLADVMEQPAQQLDQLAVQMRGPADALGNMAAQSQNLTRGINQGLGAINQIGRLVGVGFAVGNPFPGWISQASSVAAVPSNIVSRGASMARIPSGYVRTAGGYVQTPANYARQIGGWSAYAHHYEMGHQRSEKIERQQKKLRNNGNLSPVEARPIKISRLPWDDAGSS